MTGTKDSKLIFSVTLSMTEKQIDDLGAYLKTRKVEIEAGMDNVQIEDQVCARVFQTARERQKGKTA